MFVGSEDNFMKKKVSLSLNREHAGSLQAGGRTAEELLADESMNMSTNTQGYKHIHATSLTRRSLIPHVCVCVSVFYAPHLHVPARDGSDVCSFV